MCKAGLQEALEVRKQHKDFKPGLVDALFTLGAAYRTWRKKDLLLASKLAACETECERTRAACRNQQHRIDTLQNELKTLTKDLAEAEAKFAEQKSQLHTIRQSLGSAFPGIDQWLTDPD